MEEHVIAVLSGRLYDSRGISTSRGMGKCHHQQLDRRLTAPRHLSQHHQPPNTLSRIPGSLRTFPLPADIGCAEDQRQTLSRQSEAPWIHRRLGQTQQQTLVTMVGTSLSTSLPRSSSILASNIHTPSTAYCWKRPLSS